MTAANASDQASTSSSVRANPLRRALSRWRLPLMAALVVIAIAVVYAVQVFFDSDRETEAVETLPAAERAVLYERTRSTLETTCLPEGRSAGLDRHCAEQARFVLRFPECDAACRTLAQRCMPRATR